MPKTRFEEIVFTLVMATFMVYGMICYNISLNMGAFTPDVFAMALGELPIMTAIAFVLEFFLVSKLAPMLAFGLFVKPGSHPLAIVIAISFCICLIMCPIMSAIATLLFNAEPSIAVFLRTYAFNLPMAIGYQLLICGPVVRALFKAVFRRNEIAA